MEIQVKEHRLARFLRCAGWKWSFFNRWHQQICKYLLPLKDATLRLHAALDFPSSAATMKTLPVWDVSFAASWILLTWVIIFPFFRLVVVVVSLIFFLLWFAVLKVRFRILNIGPRWRLLTVSSLAEVAGARLAHKNNQTHFTVQPRQKKKYYFRLSM